MWRKDNASRAPLAQNMTHSDPLDLETVLGDSKQT